jgi:hypothetical protein
MSTHSPHERLQQCKSIEAPDIPQRHIRPAKKFENQVQTSNSRDSCKRRSRNWQLFQLRKECKSIEATSNSERPTRPESDPKLGNLVRGSNSRVARKNPNTIWKSIQLMKECKLMEVMMQMKMPIPME